jgi:alpha-beta hydrolase superfamily lysophospholipase
LTAQHPKPQLSASSALRSPDPAQQLLDDNGGRPLYFGRESRPLFGWLYSPQPSAQRPVGLVICNPFGNEAVCAQRTLRHIAERASRAGIPALRFDYDGTGDSAGSDDDPDRLKSWLASVHSAADELKNSAGVQRVCFLGIRLGSTLAAAVAAHRNDVAALVAIAPVTSGKAYVREMRLLRRAMEAKRDRAQDGQDEILEAAGFVLSAETQASLGALDLSTLGWIAPDVLVLERAELPGNTGWMESLRAAGVRVDRMAVPGYAEMMLDSHESVVPHEMIKTALDWLSALLRPGTGGKLAPSQSPLSTLAEILDSPQNSPADRIALSRTGPDSAPAMLGRERAVRFGTLFGIVSLPQDKSGAPVAANGKAVILLNAGAVHRIGPSRLYVSIARHLAAQGYTALRMDISGIGDSRPRPGAPENVVYSEHAVDDLRQALEFLRNDWNITEVHAVGLCSGAYHAFKAAVAGLPLSGVVVINPLTFFWTEGMSLQYADHRVASDIRRYRTNAYRIAPWIKLLRGNVNLWELFQVLARRTARLALTPLRSAARTLRIPFRNDLPSELLAIVRAGIRLRFVFAARDPGCELLNNLGGAVARRLRARGAIGVQLIEGADHTFTDSAARATLLAALDGAL